MTVRLAPWHTINGLEAYHGELSEQEIEEKLQDKPDGTYLMTDYNAELTGREFKLTVRQRSLPKGGIAVRAFSFEPYDPPAGGWRISHPIWPQRAHASHEQSECIVPQIFKYPLKRNEPLSLKEIARMKICTKYKFEEITAMEKTGDIPRDCGDFIKAQASTKVPTHKKLLFCDIYRINIPKSPVLAAFSST